MTKAGHLTVLVNTSDGFEGCEEPFQINTKGCNREAVHIGPTVNVRIAGYWADDKHS